MQKKTKERWESELIGLGILITPTTSKNEIEDFRNSNMNLHYVDENNNELKNEMYKPDRRDIFFDRAKYEEIYGKDEYDKTNVLIYDGEKI